MWVGCRLAPKREQLERKIVRLFADPSAPGSILLTIDKPMVDDIPLPWSWTAAVWCNQSKWTAEFAFSERLWTWMPFEMDFDLLILRTDPLAARIVLAMSSDLGVEPPPDYLPLPTTDYFEIGTDGSIEPTTNPSEP